MTIQTTTELDKFIALNCVDRSDLINKLIEHQQLVSEKIAKLILNKAA